MENEIGSFLRYVTLGCVRVAAPDVEYQAGIAKERRRDFGQRVADGAVDTYTRTHGSNMISIWEDVFGKLRPGDLSRRTWNHTTDTHTYPIALEGDGTGIEHGSKSLECLNERRTAAKSTQAAGLITRTRTTAGLWHSSCNSITDADRQ